MTAANLLNSSLTQPNQKLTKFSMYTPVILQGILMLLIRYYLLISISPLPLPLFDAGHAD